MLRRFEPLTDAAGDALCARFPGAAAAVLSAGIDAYETESVWVQAAEASARPAAFCILQRSGTAAVYAQKDADLAELDAFLRAGAAGAVRAGGPAFASVRGAERIFLMTQAAPPAREPEGPAASVCDDFFALHALLCRAAGLSANAAQANAWVARASRTFFAGRSCAYAAACASGALAATATVRFVGRYAVFEDVAALPAHRGQGLARACVEAGCRRAAKAGRLPALLCRETAAGFWEACGFAVRETMYTGKFGNGEIF